MLPRMSHMSCWTSQVHEHDYEYSIIVVYYNVIPFKKVFYQGKRKQCISAMFYEELCFSRLLKSSEYHRI